MEAIILAGGLGTRLRSVVKEVPKSMALIQGVPFLEYQLDQMIAHGVTRFIFSVGYKSECIQEHFQSEYKGCEVVYALEDKKLGTGGAIQNAMPLTTTDHVVVANGDSLFMVDLQAEMERHLRVRADVTLALKPMKNFNRYGSIRLDNCDRIIEFLEKQPITEGLINGGLYIFDVQKFRAQRFPEVFSIEKDYFEAKVEALYFSGFISDSYFLDIGIPNDFQKAQFEIGLFPKINQNWTLSILDGDLIETDHLHSYFGSIDTVAQPTDTERTICIEFSPKESDDQVYRTPSVETFVNVLKLIKG